MPSRWILPLRTFKNHIAQSLALLVLFQTSQLTYAQTPGASKFDWTKIQDLKSDAQSPNRALGSKWMVIVGASKYREKRLESPFPMDKSAEDLYGYAVDPAVGRFDKDHVRLLVNGNATKQNIMASFGNSWLGSLAGPDDLVVVFISTLSFPTTDGKAYLCAFDCALDNVYSTCLSMQDLMDTIKHNVKASRIVLILQACYSGAAELTAGSKSLGPSTYNVDLDQLSAGEGYVILSSSKPEQITWSASFSKNLINALRQNNGLITLQDAFSKARTATEYETIKVGAKRVQTPVMKSAWKGKPLILGAPETEIHKGVPAKVSRFLAAESYYLKANQAVIGGNLDDAITNYQSALKVDPEYGDALCDYASVLALKGDFEKSANLYSSAIKLSPADSLSRTNYARVLTKLGDKTKARAELNDALAEDNKNRIALVALANLDVQDANYAEAIKHYQAALALYPTSASLHDRLSYALGRSGEIESAIKQSEEAVRIDPSLMSARLNLAANRLLSGDQSGAATAYRAALKVDASNADAHYCLSHVLESMGDKAEESSELQAFLQVASSSDDRRPEVKNRLQSLQLK
jgi:tetratricopeptide (TPR) repeat protein